MTVGDIAATVAGVAMIVLVFRDVFDALFHPEGRGAFARVVTRAVWRLIRRFAPRSGLPLAGPFALMAVIGTWAALLVAGWALIYLPHFPEEFTVPAELASEDRIIGALNISLVTLTTLGFGDVTPHADALQIVVPLEALVGFGLLTASISWLLLIYPVLARRRSLAYEVDLLRKAEHDTGLAPERLEPDAFERILFDLTSRLVAVERDLVNFPISYYFAERDERFSLGRSAPHLLELARRGAEPGRPDRVRLRATMLHEAVDDFARTTAERFHRARGKSTKEALRGYARDHLQDG